MCDSNQLVLLYVLVLGGAIASAIALYLFGWREEVVLGLPFVGLVVIIALIEWLIPVTRGVYRAKESLLDVIHSLVNMIAQAGMRVGVGLILFELPSLSLSLHPIAAAVLALVCADLVWYWVHRVMHNNRHLWKIHRVHHSPGQGIYWLNASRSHPFEAAAVAANLATFLWIFQVPNGLAAIILVATGAATLLQHTNSKMRLGPLNYVFSGPELHRVHHSAIMSESNHNYGTVFIVWDLLFGSFVAPYEPERYGIEGNPLQESYWAHLASPFGKDHHH